VNEMHVDGFRFDLATTLARERHDYDRRSGFLDAVFQDPVLSRVKLIAEPWDVGDGGYQVGGFPLGWAEWNGKYRDCIRRFWIGNEGLKELGYRLTGSSDLYKHDGRSPYASINFITSHDGFTLRDLVSYQRKHNEANGEDNRDGDDNNNAWNCGIEGPTDDAQVNRLRLRQQRNLLATLLLSQGVPMLLAGDELGRTQKGNNNAYCQDGDISHVDWDLDDDQRAMLRFVRRLVALRKAHPGLRRRHFFQGVHARGSDLKDLAWFRPDGVEMRGEDWDRPVRTVALLLGDFAIPWHDEQGRRVVDDTLLVVLNAERTRKRFRLPSLDWAAFWEVLVDTEVSEQYPTPLHHGLAGSYDDPPSSTDAGRASAASAEIELEALSVVVLRSIPAPR
jgi:isoamylase